MPSCHTCKYDGKKSRRCITCPGPKEGSNHGKAHVSVDLVKDFIPAPLPLAEPDPRYDAAMHLLRVLTGLGFIEREVAVARMQGEKYIDIIARLNLILAKPMTFQAIHARIKKAVGNYPILAELFRGMVIKQQKRKPKGTEQHE